MSDSNRYSVGFLTYTVGLGITMAITSTLFNFYLQNQEKNWYSRDYNKIKYENQELKNENEWLSYKCDEHRDELEQIKTKNALLVEKCNVLSERMKNMEPYSWFKRDTYDSGAGFPKRQSGHDVDNNTKIL